MATLVTPEVLHRTQMSGQIPLENGDTLTASEFLRRYEAMPEIKKAELINGKVNMASPVRFDLHGQYDGLVQGWVGYYSASTPGLKCAPNTTARLGVDDVPQPDGMLIIEPALGGKTAVDPKGYLIGSPELVIEIAASSSSIDFTEKMDLYRRAQAREYLLVRTRDRDVNWWALNEDSYQPIAAGPDGVLRSQNFPGLWLDVSSLLNQDGLKMMEAVKRGMTSPEYLAFAADLKKRMSKA